MTLLARSRATLGECPLWSAGRRNVYWLDLVDCELHRLVRGRHTTARIDLPGPLGGLVRSSRDGEAVVFADARPHRLDLTTGRTRPLASTPLVAAGTVVNDAGVAPDGRAWTTTADAAEARPTGALQVWTDGRPRTLAGGYVVGNGPAFSPDGSIVYVSDSTAHRVLAYRVVDDVVVSTDPLVAFDPADGMPDGLAVDSDGCVWVALWGGARVVRVSPRGSVLEQRPVPARNVTSVAIGGPDLRTLVVTTALLDTPAEDAERFPDTGGLFATRLDRPGIAERATTSFDAIGTAP